MSLFYSILWQYEKCSELHILSNPLILSDVRKYTGNLFSGSWRQSYPTPNIKLFLNSMLERLVWCQNVLESWRSGGFPPLTLLDLVRSLSSIEITPALHLWPPSSISELSSTISLTGRAMECSLNVRNIKSSLTCILKVFCNVLMEKVKECANLWGQFFEGKLREGYRLHTENA